MSRLHELVQIDSAPTIVAPHKNGCVKFAVFIPIILALSSFVAGSYAYTSTRAESVRLEIKEDLREAKKEILDAIRAERK